MKLLQCSYFLRILWRFLKLTSLLCGWLAKVFWWNFVVVHKFHINSLLMRLLCDKTLWNSIRKKNFEFFSVENPLCSISTFLRRLNCSLNYFRLIYTCYKCFELMCLWNVLESFCGFVAKMMSELIYRLFA